jgi:hypothetical protein
MPITYTDKVQLTPNANPVVNQWRAVDANEVKNVVNALVVDAINDGVTDTAPSQNAVFDALALKANLTDLNITIVSITGATSLTSSAFGKLHNCTGTTIDYTIDLPTAVGNSGVSIAIKGDSALTKVVTIAGIGGQLIDGEASRQIASLGFISVLSDGTNWKVVGEVGSWINYTPTWGGFSIDPTVDRCQYFRQGKNITVQLHTSANGTSSATTKTVTVPFIASAPAQLGFTSANVNNGVVATTPGVIATRTGGSNTIDLFRDLSGLAWTASGSCRVSFTLNYIMA